MLGRPSPWHEHIYASGGAEVDELRQHVGEIGLRIGSFAIYEARKV
jgi:hypothetical protein